MKRKLAMVDDDEQDEKLHNNGVSWRRGKLLGEGAFGSVYLAELKRLNSRNRKYPPIMAVKSAEVSKSSSLRQEKEVFDNLHRICPYILQCYGEETTFDQKGDMFYNVLLEYASGGTLSSLIQQSDGYGLPESDVRRYTRCLLEGIRYIHSLRYVHCDLKPENVLLVPTENGELVPKIADFGLAKKVVKKRKNMADSFVGGTTMYMAPETMTDNIQDFPCDIWALGCIVFEMFTGFPLWSEYETTTDELVKSIADRHELPEIPHHISNDGRAFLKRCLVKNPMFRLTADMLLNQPFVSDWSPSSEDYHPSSSSASHRTHCIGGAQGRYFGQLAPVC